MLAPLQIPFKGDRIFLLSLLKSDSFAKCLWKAFPVRQNLIERKKGGGFKEETLLTQRLAMVLR